MKPRKLMIQAFGSYGKKTEIDFSVLNQNLFLITGDTGAGKTTIFDAIVFALYGEASSGNNRKCGMELQSQYADLFLEPYVELTFEAICGDKTDCYTVKRSPRHVRPKKRGSGSIEVGETVSLLMPDGQEYPPKETNKKLEEIIGLTKGQFMQVAMIAQGEFMELLRARSDEKKVIFRKLFQTEFYQKMVEELGSRRKEKQGEIGKLRTICQTEAAHIVIPENYSRNQEMAERKKRITEADRVLASDIEELIQELKLLCESLKENCSDLEKEQENASKKRDEDQAAVIHGEHLMKFYRQYEEAGLLLTACEKEEEKIKEKERLAQQIQNAWEIRELYRQWQDAQKRRLDVQKKLSEEKERFPLLCKREKEAESREKEASERYRCAVEKDTEIVQKVKRAMTVFERIRQTEKLSEEKKQAVQDMKEILQKLEQEERDLKKQSTDWQKEEEHLQDVLTERFLWEDKKKNEELLSEENRERRKLQKELEACTEKWESMKQEYESGRDTYQKYQKEYFTNQMIFLDAQAGYLAKEKLKPGHPCPVCGSIEHPQPCKLEEIKNVPDRSTLDEMAKEVQRLQNIQEEKAGQVQIWKGRTEEKRKGVQEAWKKQKEHMKRSILDLPDPIDEKEAEHFLKRWSLYLEKEKGRLQEKENVWKTVRDKLEKAAVKEEKLREEKSALQENIIQMHTQWKECEARRTELISGKEFDSEEAAQKQKRASEQERKNQEMVLEQSKAELQKARSEKDQVQTLIIKYQKEEPVLCREEQIKLDEYQSRMKERKIEEAQWQAVLNHASLKDAEEAQKQVQEQKSRKAAALKLMQTAKSEIGNQKLPDMEQLQRRCGESQKKLDEIRQTLENRRTSYHINETAYRKLEPNFRERSRILEEFRKTDRLYQLLSGNVSGSRMDMETFVQRTYLKQILQSANKRFREMTGGQFELRMYQLDKAGEGKNHGLDLMVYSSVTGKEREVRTLSGGESFMAALALALGMADQIQQNRSSIHLDMMFIDEGFGSLDEHSRNQAVRVLKRMADKTKMIGMISHVTELKQEVDEQLLITKDQEGSHIRWQLS